MCQHPVRHAQKITLAIRPAARSSPEIGSRRNKKTLGIRGSYMAGWTGLEPAAFCVTGRRSNQLSYHPVREKSGERVKPFPASQAWFWIPRFTRVRPLGGSVFRDLAWQKKRRVDAQTSAVTGEITSVTRETRFAGKPPSRACSRMTSSFGAR